MNYNKAALTALLAAFLAACSNPSEPAGSDQNTDTPNSDTPVLEAPGADTPDLEAPENQAPENQAPEDQAPENQAPENEAPENEAPENEAPENEAPESEAPENEAPENEAPENEAPENEAPENQAPENEESENEESEPETPEIEPELSNETGLQSLIINSGTLTPDFSNEQTSYSLSTEEDNLTITALAIDSKAVVKINDQALNSETKSITTPLTLGRNDIAILVTAEDGSTRDFQLEVLRTSPPVLFSHLSSDASELLPAFRPERINQRQFNLYTNATSAVLSTELSDAYSSVQLNGEPIADASSITLAPIGEGITTFDIVITAMDGITKSHYQIHAGNLADAWQLGEESDLAFSKLEALSNGNYVDWKNTGRVILLSPAKEQPLKVINIDKRGGEHIAGGVHKLWSGDFLTITQYGTSNYEESGDLSHITEDGNITIRLYDGFTGEQIGQPLENSFPFEFKDFYHPYDTDQFDNGNFSFTVDRADHNGVENVGAIRFFNGQTFEQIGETFYGQSSGDLYRSIMYSFKNLMFVRAAYADRNDTEDAGEIRLISAETGKTVGKVLTGEQPEQMGYGQMSWQTELNTLVLANAIKSGDDVSHTFIYFVDLTTGEQFGETYRFEGDARKLRSFDNGNFWIGSEQLDANGLSQAGSFQLFDGKTGQPIGPLYSGLTENAQFGKSFVDSNNNNIFVVQSGTEPAQLTFINSLNGQQIGSNLELLPSNGKASSLRWLDDDRLLEFQTGNANGDGQSRIIDATTASVISGIFSATEEGYSVKLGSPILDEAGNYHTLLTKTHNESGEIEQRLLYVDGASNTLIKSSPVFSEFLALPTNEAKVGVLPLANGNWLIAGENATYNELAFAGVIQLLDGESLEPLGEPYFGKVKHERLGDEKLRLNNGNLLFSSYKEINEPFGNGTGTIRLIDGSTGLQLGETIQAHSKYGFNSPRMHNFSDEYVVASSGAARNLETDSQGKVWLINAATGEIAEEFASRAFFMSLNQDFFYVFTSNKTAALVSQPL